MASTINSIDKSIASLAQSFQTAIKATIDSESAPLNRTKTQKDQLDVRRGVYTDIRTNFDALQSAMQAMISSHASYTMSMVPKLTTTPGTVGGTTLTATATEGAAAADYDVIVSQLAKAQIKSTTAAYSTDSALGKSGTFWLGGTGTKSVSVTPNDTVTGSATSTVATGQREMGTGSYTLETRDFNGARQFRMVNADGTAVSIRRQSGSEYTNDWQTFTSGTVDTGRGLTLTLDKAGASASTAISYTAAGTSINISATDTLRTITAAINAASQPNGRAVKASIVANKLVLSSAQTGENHSMLFTLMKDGVANDFLGFGADLQSAQNAKFTVNGMSVSRATNTDLKDVIDGVTLNLAADAETNKTARISIAASTDKSVGLMNSMITKFNTALSHIKGKLASTPTTGADGKTTYTRGPLSGDMGFSGLRFEMINRFNSTISNSGSFKNFSDIGLTFDKDMKLTLDSAKFSDALKNNASDVTALLDSGLGALNTIVSRYAGETGSLAASLKTFDSQRSDYDRRIAKLNDSLTIRKTSLYNQYMNYQNQIADYGRTAQMFGIITGSNTNTSA